MNQIQKIIVLGKEVADLLQKDKELKVEPSYEVAGCWESESLCRWQRDIRNRGFIGAELVKSKYGWSLRYRSGLDNFGLIRSCTHGDLDGTLKDAICAAREWVTEDPAKRWVEIRDILTQDETAILKTVS